MGVTSRVRVLCVNSGSSSLKLALYDDENRIASCDVEGIGLVEGRLGTQDATGRVVPDERGRFSDARAALRAALAGIPARRAPVARRRRAPVADVRVEAPPVGTGDSHSAIRRHCPPGREGFFFRLPNDGTVAGARTFEEFDHALSSVPTASLQYHVARGDFSRWVRDVVGDADLAVGLAKLEATSGAGVPVERDEIRRHLHARCVL